MACWQVVSSEGGWGAELELFPLCLKICGCDSRGTARGVDRELLFSRWGMEHNTDQ